ncbi:MAG: hypothetical protein MUF87_14555 [Anaerolineae bacterium]|nr:hypothetical protein [Anaerolineae bacterium]
MIKRLLAVLAVVVLAVIPATAHETTSARTVLTAVQRADSGQLTLVEDETYTLVLEGVAEALPYTRAEGRVRAAVVSSAAFAEAWAAEEDLTLEGAVLTYNGEALVFDLSQPTYDALAGTYTYTAVLTKNAAGVEITEEAFSAPTLFLRQSETFVAALSENMMDLGLRGGCLYPCE